MRKKKSPNLPSTLFAEISFFLYISCFFLCVIQSFAVNLCTDISICWHSYENPQKHQEGFFNWILLAAQGFSANIYHMKFLYWLIFPQVFYTYFFTLYLTFSDIFRLFSTIDAYQIWTFFSSVHYIFCWYICEKKSRNEIDEENLTCQKVLY